MKLTRGRLQRRTFANTLLTFKEKNRKVNRIKKKKTNERNKKANKRRKKLKTKHEAIKNN
jgi:hypothetical protein